MKKISIYPTDIICSFTRQILYEKSNKLTWKSDRYKALIAVITVLTRECKIEIRTFLNYLNILNTNRLALFVIEFDPKESLDKYKVEKLFDDFTLVIFKISYQTFLNVMKERGSMIEDLENRSLYVFRNVTWSQVVKDLYDQKIEVHGGKTGMRHPVSVLSLF